MVSMNELKQDMITGMGYIGLDSGRLYRMRRGPKLIEAVASGTTIIINDATEGRPFLGLRVFGKSTQVKTTGAQLLDESKVKQNNFRAFEYINLPVGEGTFTLSSNIPKSSTDSSAYIMLISGNVQEISPENTTATNGVYKGQSRTFPSINGYVTIAYRNDANSNNIINFNDYWYMLNKGAEEKPHEPYTGGKPSPNPEYPQEIVSAGEGGSIAVGVTGKNFATIDVDEYLKSGWQGRIEPINNGIKIIAINGWHMELLYIPFLAGKEITVSFTYRQIPEETSSQNTNNAFCFVNTNVYPNDSKDIKFKINSPSIDSTKVSCSFVARSAYLGFFIRLDKEGSDSGLKRTIEITNFQIELGNKETPYEPYTHQTLTLQTPNGLPGVPVSKDGNYTDADGQQWVCDEIDLERGKYVQRVVIENISGGWKFKPSSDMSGRFFQYDRLTNVFQTAAKTAVCNIASFSSWGVPVNDKYTFALNGHNIYFSPPKGLEITAEELNAKLNSLSFPVVVVGELATPIERDLTPEEIAAYKALRTYGPTTVVSNDAGAEMEVTYVADRKEN